MSEAVNCPMKKKECFCVDNVEDHIVKTSVTKESLIDDAFLEESICPLKLLQHHGILI